MIVRIIADIALLLSIFYLPVWLSLIFGMILVFHFTRYYEFIIFAVIVDMLYGLPQEQFFGIEYVTAMIAIVIFFIEERFKHGLRYHGVY